MTLADLFARPQWWPLLLGAPLAWLLLRRAAAARARRLGGLLGARAGRLVGGKPGGAFARPALVACSALAAALAVLEPVGAAEAGMERRGADVVLCLDVSRSMLARDHAPSRLDAARAAIRALAARARGDRLALVVFAGEAKLAVPLTRDMESFALLADGAGVESVARGGTDLGAALDAALAALRGASEGASVVVLTDGEDLGGRGLAAARRCLAASVTVHCVGYGSPLGAKVALRGPGGDTLLRDRAGAEVVTSMDPHALRAIAERTGGSFAAASDSADALGTLYERRILPRARRVRAQDADASRASLHQWPLAVALALWILDLCRFDRGRR